MYFLYGPHFDFKLVPPIYLDIFSIGSSTRRERKFNLKTFIFFKISLKGFTRYTEESIVPHIAIITMV